MVFYIGVDTGGTFTDCVVMDEKGVNKWGNLTRIGGESYHFGTLCILAINFVS